MTPEIVGTDTPDAVTPISLPLGDVLSIKDLYPIASSETSYSIAFLGETGSGKTTLITTIYQLFLTKVFESIWVAGSKTFQAFEERAFYTRTQSYNHEPQTLRTQRGSLNDLLYMRLFLADQEKHINLLFTDSSGEEFQDIIGNVDLAAHNFPIIHQARFICVVLDGARLSDIITKAVEIQTGIQLLKTFIDSNSLQDDAKVFLVISKCDLIVSDDSQSHEELQELIVSEFEEQVPGVSGCLKVFLTAAMPHNETRLEIGYGIPELIRAFIAEDSSPNNDTGFKDDDLVTDNQFDLLKGRIIDAD